jgi:hypothetical protein
MAISNSTINFQDLLVNMLGKLSEREQEILKKRYHLTSDLEKKSTLKQIGDFYNITRERVRQIEKEAIRKLLELKQANEFSDQLNALDSELKTYLEQNGGLAREDHLLENHAKANHEFGFLHTNAYLFALENLIDSAKVADSHDDLYRAWHLKDANIDSIADYLKQVEAHVGENGKVFSKEDILSAAEDKLTAELRAAIDKYLEKHSGLELATILNSYLNASTKIEKNILGNWGLATWDNVRPKKLGDKIQLVFEKTNEPLHFREIADQINGANFDHKNVCAATVHNELIANGNYVLIGRGIYALKDWGYMAGTVADIIESILTKSDKPMTKDELYNEVLKQRKVNKSTIYLTLINKDKFEKAAANTFTLKK